MNESLVASLVVLVSYFTFLFIYIRCLLEEYEEKDL